MRPSFYPNGRNGHKQRSSLWGTGPVDPGGRSQVHGWAEPQRLRGGCDGNATSGRTGPGRCWSVQTGPGPRGHPILEDRVLGPCWVWRGLRAWGMGSLPPWLRGPQARAPGGWAPCHPGAVAPGPARLGDGLLAALAPWPRVIGGSRATSFAEGTFLPWTTRCPCCCWHLQQGRRGSESWRCLPRLPSGRVRPQALQHLTPVY